MLLISGTSYFAESSPYTNGRVFIKEAAFPEIKFRVLEVL